MRAFQKSGCSLLTIVADRHGDLGGPLLISGLRPWFACYSGSGARKSIAQKVNCRAGESAQRFTP
jgi:hypothetical protein